MMQRLRNPLLFLALAALFSVIPARRARALDLLIDVLATGVTDNNGDPLGLGTVTFYDAGTTNLRTVYTDFALATPAANPATLDTAGRLVVYTNKRVKLLIKDVNGATIRTIDNVGSADADIAAAAIAGGITTVIPLGVMLPYTGTTAPAGWLLCDGTTVSQVQYADLYALVGTAFNTGGEAAGTFRLPGTARRVLVGAGGGGTATLGNALGNRGGEETHTLLTAELPVHLHAFGTIAAASDGAHAHSISETNHTHRLGMCTAAGGALTSILDAALEHSCSVIDYTVMAATEIDTHSANIAVQSGGAHTHTISGSTANTGSGTAHNVIQPSLVVNYIIKY